jgi:lipoprotein-anchoring transpeptidase ErfK/SrfK
MHVFRSRRVVGAVDGVFALTERERGGCIRMYNADILDLYGRIGFGTPVVVIR